MADESSRQLVTLRSHATDMFVVVLFFDHGDCIGASSDEARSALRKGEKDTTLACEGTCYNAIQTLNASWIVAAQAHS
ncbi:MAG: hypothetical protein ABR613_08170 [Actinomycetota bacterium]